MMLLPALFLAMTAEPDWNSDRHGLFFDENRWVACANLHTIVLDDGVSDARSVGAAVAQACSHIHFQIMCTYADFASIEQFDRAYRLMVADDTDSCTLRVLQARTMRGSKPARTAP